MRVMLLHKVDADTEAGKMPPAALVADVGRMVADMQAAGVFRDGAGLRASSSGVRLTFAGGRRSAVEGPFVGRREDPAALCVLRVRSRDEAVEHATHLAALLGDGECDIRPVTGATLTARATTTAARRVLAIHQVLAGGAKP